MTRYWLTYETKATLTYLVEADSEEEAQAKWQSDAVFDLDHLDFAVEGATGTPGVSLRRLEMLDPIRELAIEEAAG